MFKLAELTEVMPQKGDGTSIDLLNNVRTALYRIMMLIYPTDVLHIFAENRPADQHNYVS